MDKLLKYLIIMSVYIVFNSGSSYAHTEIIFGPEDTDLKASIRYTVIGVYKSQFDDFQGKITLHPETYAPQSVDLIIKAETIRSSCSWCDKIVRSKQLLDVEKFSEIVFKSKRIFKEDNVYKVEGELSLHGVTKEYVFPFMVENVTTEGKDQKLSISGSWTIDRKAFDIVWSKYLDKGGVLVGNDIIVDWSVTTIVN